MIRRTLSMLAAALAYRLDMPRDWFRIGAWDYRTLLEMLALRFGTTRARAETASGPDPAPRAPHLQETFA